MSKDDPKKTGQGRGHNHDQKHEQDTSAFKQRFFRLIIETLQKR